MKIEAGFSNRFRIVSRVRGKRRTVFVFMNDSFSRKEVLIASSEFEKQEEPPSV
ncbi:MAG TPA: hypothetical protein VNT20_09045 [Flavisolibacter sp.]|jgi:hypothetical protein|nr:hypothetical protein [Flavisolibacter sp.]